VFGKRLASVWRVSGKCLASVWRVSVGKCLLASVWQVSVGKCQPVGRSTGRQVGWLWLSGRSIHPASLRRGLTMCENDRCHPHHVEFGGKDNFRISFGYAEGRSAGRQVDWSAGRLVGWLWPPARLGHLVGRSTQPACHLAHATCHLAQATCHLAQATCSISPQTAAARPCLL
jgi:hypothetical protein